MIASDFHLSVNNIAVSKFQDVLINTFRHFLVWLKAGEPEPCFIMNIHFHITDDI